MTAFCGIFWQRESNARGDQDGLLREAWRASMEGLRITERLGARTLFLHADLNAFDDSQGLISENGSLGMVAGHPYLRNFDGKHRGLQISQLVRAIESSKFDELSSARGTFSLASIDASESHLNLATDALGIRPLYWSQDGERVLFSTQLSLMRLLVQPERLDPRGAAEAATFGFCLGRRTPYAGIFCLEGGVALRFSTGAQELHTYLDWPKSVAAHDETTSLQLVRRAFDDAIRIRLSTDRRVSAYLTGGLDSRCIVAAIREMGIEVNSMNFAPAGTQDLVFGGLLGEKLGTNHLGLAMPLGSVSSKMAYAMPRWRKALDEQKKTSDRPTLAWSGDGGSVALGHVYLNDSIVDTMEEGDEDNALKNLLEKNDWKILHKILKSQYRESLRDAAFSGMKQELSEVTSDDGGRRLHMMLLRTDQHRHLHEHFENIAIHKAELQLPFFDSDFVRLIVGMPIRPFLNHRFYNKWLGTFDRRVGSVPWQAYPGHEPCPIPLPAGLGYQWDASSRSWRDRLAATKLAAALLVAAMKGDFRGTVVSTPRLLGVCMITLLGSRRYAYLLRYAETIRCQARLPGPLKS